MPRLLLGEDSAIDVDDVLRNEFDKPPTVRDLRKKVNELKHKTHNDNAINNWASYHALGQAAVAENLLARTKGKPKPSWWHDGMPVAEHHIETATELVVLRTSGVAIYDEAVGLGQEHLREIAPRLAVGKQHLVVGTADSIDLCTQRFMHANEVNELKDEMIAMLREMNDALKRERGRDMPAPRVISRRRVDGEELRRAENEESPLQTH